MYRQSTKNLSGFELKLNDIKQIIMSGNFIRRDSPENIQVPQSQRNQDLARTITAMYVQSAPILIQVMRDAAAAGDLRELFRAADALKSSSANLGATRLAELCSSLAQMPSKQALAGVPEILDEIAKSISLICSGAAENEPLFAAA